MAQRTVTIRGVTVPVLHGRTVKRRKVARKHLSSVVNSVQKHLQSRFGRL
ncbi:hypothetical protein J4219_05295 [Candidatus Woesearchaeota archaeon]|nr:hypothetical protein [Candidatus Woesearchaeota archaeon]